MRFTLSHKCAALLLAANYAAFQVEAFDAEYEANHPEFPDRLAFASSSLTWETFGKQNAPKAFVCDPGLWIEYLGPLPSPPGPQTTPSGPYEPVRDKSPPLPAEPV